MTELAEAIGRINTIADEIATEAEKMLSKYAGQTGTVPRVMTNMAHGHAQEAADLRLLLAALAPPDLRNNVTNCEDHEIPHPAGVPWLFETADGQSYFATENQACTVQRMWREKRGLDPITGEPRPNIGNWWTICGIDSDGDPNHTVLQAADADAALEAYKRKDDGDEYGCMIEVTVYPGWIGDRALRHTP